MSQQQIIDDIRTQAEAEAEKIRTQHRESLEKRKKSLRGREESIAADAEERIAGGERDIRTRLERNTEQEERRILLELQERVIRAVIEKTKEKIVSLRDTDRYRVILKEWAVEAVIGLGLAQTEGVVLRHAPEDRSVVDSVLEDVVAECSTSIEIDNTALAPGTVGVMVLDEQGRRAYSNTLDDRVRRAEHGIHRIVVTRLFSGSEV